VTASSDQVRRMLTLVPYLQRRGEVSLAETAAVFGVSPEQLVNDVNALWFCGLPGGLTDDLIDVDMDAIEAGRISLSNADFLSTPMRFTPDEALSLIVALQAIAELADDDGARAVQSAIAKLQGAQVSAGERSASEVVVTAEAGSAAVRRVLMDAIEAKQTVVLTYEGAVGSVPWTGEVEPARLETVDGYAYVQAWSMLRRAWRTYRLDRIDDARPTGHAATGHGEPEAFTSGWLDQRPDAALVTLELANSARWIIEYYPVRDVRPTPRGVEVALLVADPSWLRTLLLRLGGQVLRVDPPEAARSAAESAAETLAAYGLEPRPVR